jgi:branched-chain amino acid transport system permease protein
MQLLRFYDRVKRQVDDTATTVWGDARLRWIAILSSIAVLAVAPAIVSSTLVRLAIEVAIYGIFALSLNLLIGYTGLLSFGHAAFFGTPAYIALLFLTTVTTSVWLIVPVAIMVTLVLALIIGYLSLQSYGIYFAMLTLAFSQVVYVLAQNEPFGLSGGSNGLISLEYPNFGIPGVVELQLSTVEYFYLAVVLLVAVYYIVHRVVNSPFGSVLIAIRENEDRVSFAGYNVLFYKLASFTLSAVLCSLSGLLFAFYYRAVSPEHLFWFWSGEGVAMVILGGTGWVVGPILGAIAFIGIREAVSPFLTDWTIALGIVFVATILIRSLRD